MGATNITPQGYTYAIEPNTTHPFWRNGSDSNYIYTDLKNPVVLDNTDTNYTRFDAVLTGDVSFIAPLTLALVSVAANTEVALPFVGVGGDIAFLICNGVDANSLKVVGVYSSTDMSDLTITNVVSIPAPIKGDKGDNGQDGVTPQITATASVDQTTGVASVQVTKSGTDTHPAFDFSFTGVKGERGERGENGRDGAKGDKGDNGADGVTPQITATASVDQTTGNAAVNVTKTGTDANPSFSFDFTGLKGARGEKGQDGAKGEKGDTGATGTTGATGATPDITVNATVDDTTGTPSVQVTKSGTLENPVFDLAFTGLKGEGGGGDGGYWKVVGCGNGTALGQLLTTLQESGIYECYISFFNFSLVDADLFYGETFTAYKPYDGTTEGFSLGSGSRASMPLLRGVKYVLQKREMGGDVRYQWQAVSYQQFGYKAKFTSSDGKKTLTLPIEMSPPSITNTMTDFPELNAMYVTQGGTCYLKNANAYSAIIINENGGSISTKAGRAEVFYKEKI